MTRREKFCAAAAGPTINANTRKHANDLRAFGDRHRDDV
jgi:hypothetical protein